MTSEVAILNKHGVALAADSAVTVQIASGPNNQSQKIYNSANKLFALSKHHPIGIMISNQADFGFIPWETVIKEFREHLGTASYDSLEKYVASFKSFVASSNLLRISEDFDVERMLSLSMKLVFDEIECKEKELFAKHNQVTSSQVRSAIRSTVNSLLSNATPRFKSSVFTQSDITLLKRRNSKHLNSSFQNLFQNRPVSQAVKKNILDCTCIFALLPGNPRTTIAIAGFGNDELLPAVYSLEAQTRFNGKMQILETSNVVTPQSPAFVKAFAQNDEVATFVTGVSKKLSKLILDSLKELLTKQLPKQVAASLPGHVKNLSNANQKKIEQINRQFGRNAHAAFQVQLEAYIKSNNVDQIMNTVSSLPLNQIAEMAEALVNLESFKKQVSFQDETVGGPIDVAVISKGDGLVWIKRKHYFLPELNYQYFSTKYPMGTPNA